MSETISSNLNAGNSINTANTGGTIQSSIGGCEGLGISLKPQTNAQIAEQAEAKAGYYAAASEARYEVGKALYGEAGAKSRGYDAAKFDQEKQKAIGRGLTTIQSAHAPEGMNKSISAGVFSGSVQDFNEFLLGESHRAIHETVNAYLDYQPFSEEFKAAHRVDPNDKTNTWESAWGEDDQREAQKDLLRQQWKGTRQVDTVFRSNNPWYVERTGAEDVQREYFDLREQGLTPEEAVAQVKPKINETEYQSAIKGRWMNGGRQGTIFMGSDTQAARLAYDPKGNLSTLENDYKKYVKQIETPLNLDFGNRVYIPYANPMQAEINRAQYQELQDQRDKQEAANASVQAMADLSNAIYQSGGGLYNVSELRSAGVTSTMNSATAASAVRGWEFSGRPEGITQTNSLILGSGSGEIKSLDYSVNPNTPNFQKSNNLTVDYIGNVPQGYATPTQADLYNSAAVATDMGGKSGYSYADAAIFYEGGNEPREKQQSDRLTLITFDRRYLTRDKSGKYGVETIPKGSYVDGAELRRFESDYQDWISAEQGSSKSGSAEYSSLQLLDNAFGVSETQRKVSETQRKASETNVTNLVLYGGGLAVTASSPLLTQAVSQSYPIQSFALPMSVFSNLNSPKQLVQNAFESPAALVPASENFADSNRENFVAPLTTGIDNVIPTPTNSKSGDWIANDFVKGFAADTVDFLVAGAPQMITNTATKVSPFEFFPLVAGMSAISKLPESITATNLAVEGIKQTATENPARLAGNAATMLIPTGAIMGAAKTSKFVKVLTDVKIPYVRQGGTLKELKAITTIANNQDILSKSHLIEGNRVIKSSSAGDQFSLAAGIKNVDNSLASGLTQLGKSAKPITLTDKMKYFITPQKYDPELVAYGTGSNIGRAIPMQRITSDLDVYVRSEDTFNKLIKIGKNNKAGDYIVDKHGAILKHLPSGKNVHAVDTHIMPQKYAGVKNMQFRVDPTYEEPFAPVAYPFRVIPSKRGHLEYRANDMVSERFSEQLRRKAAGSVGQFGKKTGKLEQPNPAEHREKDVYDLVADTLQQAKFEAGELSKWSTAAKLTKASMYVGKKRAIHKNVRAVETLMRSPRISNIVYRQHIELAEKGDLTKVGEQLSLDKVAVYYNRPTKFAGEFDFTTSKKQNPIYDAVFGDESKVSRQLLPPDEPKKLNIRFTRNDEIREWNSPLSSPQAVIGGTAMIDSSIAAIQAVSSFKSPSGRVRSSPSRYPTGGSSSHSPKSVNSASQKSPIVKTRGYTSPSPMLIDSPSVSIPSPSYGQVTVGSPPSLTSPSPTMRSPPTTRSPAFDLPYTGRPTTKPPRSPPTPILKKPPYPTSRSQRPILPRLDFKTEEE